MADHGGLDLALLRGLVQARMSRRRFLGYAGMGAVGLGLSGLLAACGGTSKTSSAPSASGATGTTGGFDWASQEITGGFTFANWPLYIDRDKVDGERVHPSLELFMKETGITVDYKEVIQAYDEFFAKIRVLLEAGQPTDYDLVVMGYPKWLPLMMANDYLIPLDHEKLPNFAANAAEKYKDPAYDPGNTYSIPYMSGITGIGYDPELTGREITSVMDLFDPAFEGKVGMFGDTEDMPNLTLLGMGVEPSESTEDDWHAAADLLTKQRDDGIVRQYFGQNYVSALTSGNVALTMAWSADVLQLQMGGFPQLRFVVPDEGAMLWTDSLCIPVNSQHPLDALTFMDFIYRPDMAAMIVGWIQNVSPVPTSQDILREQASPVADSPLVFPTPEMYGRLHGYRVLTPEEQQVWDQIFQPIFQG
ncbi:MAG: ABC transporter substrate-binding protein [Actinomycetota bacterium]